MRKPKSSALTPESRAIHKPTAQITQQDMLKVPKRDYKKVVLKPRNIAQQMYVDALYTKRLVFAVGPAGTGKSYLTVLRAIEALRNGEVSKILVSRPAVSVDEDHGFLPGDINEKMAPWTRPLFDIFEEFYGKIETNRMLINGIIEIGPLAFLRGRTFKDTFVILDEAQNTTVDQMKMVLTRIGEGSTMVITGDLAQHDRGFGENGLKNFLEHLKRSKSNNIAICEFERKDIERDALVAEILNIYGDE